MTQIDMPGEVPHGPDYPVSVIYQGHCMDVLRTLPAESVQCCVTSPPYFGLRAYGTEQQAWPDGWCGELGGEPTVQMYVEHLLAVFREVRRVLRPDGVLWLNLGDSYAGSGNGSNDYRPDGASLSKNDAKYKGQKPGFRPGSDRADGIVDERAQRNRDGLGVVPGLKPKDLIGVPWRVAFALQEDGWWLRSDIIWQKANPMPESVRDRPTRSHEYVFLLTKAARYYWDYEAVREPANPAKQRDIPVRATRAAGNTSAGDRRINYEKQRHKVGFRALRDVWTFPTQPYKGMHFAVMPENLVKPCVLAGTSGAGCCPKCGSPWERITERIALGDRDDTGRTHGLDEQRCASPGAPPEKGWESVTNTLGWQATCHCNGGDLVPCVVLDPFSGAGTVGKVALELRRRFIGIELNPEYVALSKERLATLRPRLW